MPLIRFATARDVFEAFATAQQDVDAEPSDAPPLQYLQSLVDRGLLNSAVTFCAYLLPRREAVGWACRCVRRLAPRLPAGEELGLQVAEEWVEVPEEDRRIAALELGMRSNHLWPSTWLALAAGWSGGNILLGAQAAAPAPPQQTARAVRAAVLAAVSRLAPAERAGGQRSCIEDGIRIASDGEQ
jgi:Family of unknown function (DUF6931)